ncbi:phosphatase PAP2 family protein [Streptomyces sp. NBC_01497]|uniref:phosphatase PAP2 family protein n=1 Tax=Streptomyces sp. NBC_01497 TaxID=2903885 RepID=UPI002E367D99|nr:phosphatase PAP2 family protein [Streptomyces sp. NBC_01497]
MSGRQRTPYRRGGPDPGRLGGRAPLLLGPACLLAFAALAAAVTTSSTVPLPGDASVAHWAVTHRPAVAVATARALTSTGTGAVPYLLAALAGLVAGPGLLAGGQGPRARGWGAVICSAVLLAGQGLRLVALAAIARPRPPAADWATHASNWSFPSGHATTSAITAGLLVGAVLVRAPRFRGTLVALVLCWGVAVGLTRAYLAVHWASDVVGGWLFATAWLCLCALLLGRPARLARREVSGPEPSHVACPPRDGQHGGAAVPDDEHPRPRRDDPRKDHG